MLSFREVHCNDASVTAPSPYAYPGFYLPGPISFGSGGDGADPGSGGGTSPGASTAALFYLATCPSSLQVGQAVYVTGPATVDVADCQRPDPVVGIATSKRSATIAVVQTAGEVVLGLNGLSPGVDYFLGGNGQLSPPPLSGILYVQRVGVATTDSRLYLQLDGHVVKQSPS